MNIVNAELTVEVPVTVYPNGIFSSKGKNIVSGTYTVENEGKSVIHNSICEHLMKKWKGFHYATNIDNIIEGSISMNANSIINIPETDANTTVKRYMYDNRSTLEYRFIGTVSYDLVLTLEDHESKCPTLIKIVRTWSEYDIWDDKLKLVQ